MSPSWARIKQPIASQSQGQVPKHHVTFSLNLFFHLQNKVIITGTQYVDFPLKPYAMKRKSAEAQRYSGQEI